jgi:hypothetical protein
MEPEGSLPHSQEPATCHYPEKFTTKITNCICVHMERMDLKIRIHSITHKITSEIGFPLHLTSSFGA